MTAALPVTKSTVSAKIKKRQAALIALPADDPDFAEERAVLNGKVDALKKGIAESKPIGARIDRARDTLLRAHARKAEAAEALRLASELSWHLRKPRLPRLHPKWQL